MSSCQKMGCVCGLMRGGRRTERREGIENHLMLEIFGVCGVGRGVKFGGKVNDILTSN